MNRLILNIMFLITLLIILIYFLKIQKVLENFQYVFGTNSLVNKRNCTYYNNCFPGSYLHYYNYNQKC